MRRLIPLAGVLLLTACGNMLNPEGKTATPSPSPLPSGVANIVASDEALPPGRYARHDFAPRVTFDLEGPWFGRQVYEGFFDIQQGDADSPDVVAVQFGRPIAIYGADGAEEPTDAADAAAILETNPDLVIVETSTSEMGGLEGSQITVENANEPRTPRDGSAAEVDRLRDASGSLHRHGRACSISRGRSRSWPGAAPLDRVLRARDEGLLVDHGTAARRRRSAERGPGGSAERYRSSTRDWRSST